MSKIYFFLYPFNFDSICRFGRVWTGLISLWVSVRGIAFDTRSLSGQLDAIGTLISVRSNPLRDWSSTLGSCVGRLLTLVPVRDSKDQEFGKPLGGWKVRLS